MSSQTAEAFFLNTAAVSLYLTGACEHNGKSAAIRESIVLPR
jgi:hypothetical protein